MIGLTNCLGVRAGLGELAERSGLQDQGTENHHLAKIECKKLKTVSVIQPEDHLVLPLLFRLGTWKSLPESTQV